jgi:hypothetical protein
VLVGGGLLDDNAQIWNAMIELGSQKLILVNIIQLQINAMIFFFKYTIITLPRMFD